MTLANYLKGEKWHLITSLGFYFHFLILIFLPLGTLILQLIDTFFKWFMICIPEVFVVFRSLSAHVAGNKILSTCSLTIYSTHIVLPLPEAIE